MSDAAVSARQSGTQTDGSGDFHSAIDQAPSELKDDLARLADWAESLEAEGVARLGTRSGTSGIACLKPLLHSGGVALVTITCDVKSSYMQFFRSVFERRARKRSLRSRPPSAPRSPRETPLGSSQKNS